MLKTVKEYENAFAARNLHIQSIRKRREHFHELNQICNVPVYRFIFTSIDHNGITKAHMPVCQTLLVKPLAVVVLGIF